MFFLSIGIFSYLCSWFEEKLRKQKSIINDNNDN